MAADDESPGKERPSTRRWSMGTERRVQVSESLREMFQALPQMMTRRTSEVILPFFGSDNGNNWQYSSVHAGVMLEFSPDSFVHLHQQPTLTVCHHVSTQGQLCILFPCLFAECLL